MTNPLRYVNVYVTPVIILYVTPVCDTVTYMWHLYVTRSPVCDTITCTHELQVRVQHATIDSRSNEIDNLLIKN